MALEGTHIRLAIDLMDKYDIKDISEYISGTLYPDSRYVTKISRNLTHDEKFLKNGFANSDFKKGWQIHLLCDEIQGKLIREMTNTKSCVIKQNDETWIVHTAIKILQEISDLKEFDVHDYIQYAKITFIPNNEDKEKLNEYYEFCKNFYTKNNIEPEDHREILKFFGIPKEIENDVMKKCSMFQNDPVKMEEMSNLYKKLFQNLIKIVKI